MPSFELYGHAFDAPFSFITYLHRSPLPPDLHFYVNEQVGGFRFNNQDIPIYYQSSFLFSHDRPRIRIWKTRDELQVEVLEFSFSIKEYAINAYVSSDFDQERLENIFFHTIMPIWLEWKGTICLHASAISVGNVGIGFLANSGIGKSTLASYLISSGHQFITDDILAINCYNDQIVALPGCPELGLRYAQSELFVEWPSRSDTMSDKLRVAIPRERCTKPAISLAALFILTRGNEHSGIDVNQLSPAASYIELLRYSYAIPMVKNPDPQRFSRLTLIASQLPVFELHYPPGESYIPEVDIAIRKILAKI